MHCNVALLTPPDDDVLHVKLEFSFYPSEDAWWVPWLTAWAPVALVLLFFFSFLRQQRWGDAAGVVDADWAVRMAGAYLAEGRLMEAMVVCKKAIKVAPAGPNPRVMLARIFVAKRKPKQAAEALKKAVELDPNHDGAQVLLTQLP